LSASCLELYSIDGEIWASDLRQIEKRMKERQREHDKIAEEARKFFKSRVGMR
jgi:hypothetical protein